MTDIRTFEAIVSQSLHILTVECREFCKEGARSVRENFDRIRRGVIQTTSGVLF